jgi:hypothetical protein
MSTNTMSAVSAAFKFASDKVKENVVAYAKRENLEIAEGEMKQLLNVVNLSIEQAFVLTSPSISQTLEK